LAALWQILICANALANLEIRQRLGKSKNCGNALANLEIVTILRQIYKTVERLWQSKICYSPLANLEILATLWQILAVLNN
jgi:hypothetical protein